jgi:hypothetical protein
MTKTKSVATYRPNANELQFYSSLTLDAAIKCLEKLPPDYEVKIIAANTDDCRFEIRYGNRRVTDAALGRGLLRRWEGTFTRVDCEGQILGEKQRPKQPRLKLNYYSVLALILAGIAFLALVIPLVFSLSPAMGTVLTLAGTLFTIEMLRPRNQHAIINPIAVIFTALEEAFASAGIVTDTPDTLAEQAAYAHLTITDDDEELLDDAPPKHKRDER